MKEYCLVVEAKDGLELVERLREISRRITEDNEEVSKMTGEALWQHAWGLMYLLEEEE